jgi:hypothetical protein
VSNTVEKIAYTTTIKPMPHKSGRKRKRFSHAGGFAPLIALILIELVHAPHIRAQSRPDGAAKLPSFEVVSVKPYPPKYWPTFTYMRFTPGFIWKNTIAQDVLAYAYDLQARRVSRCSTKVF